MTTQLTLGGIPVDVVLKDIKNVHLSVNPPTGRVRISAPLRMNLDTIRVFAAAKLPWIRAQQRKLVGQERESPREYLESESHYVWGTRYLLRLREADAAPKVELHPSALVLQVRPGSKAERKAQVLEDWYREQVKAAAAPLIAKWERLIGVPVSRCHVQRMKTKWGSCVPASASIRLNTELGKKPRECLEYIVVHEMTHLLEPTHNRRFATQMDRFLPGWQSCRDLLNGLPVRHETWPAESFYRPVEMV